MKSNAHGKVWTLPRTKAECLARLANAKSLIERLPDEPNSLHSALILDAIREANALWQSADRFICGAPMPKIGE